MLKSKIERSAWFISLFISIFGGGLLSPAFVLAQASPRCELKETTSTGFVLTPELLDEVAVIGGDVRPLELVSRINDLTGDGIREVLALESGGRISVRNGATLAEIQIGAFPFQLPAGAVSTQMGLIGDLQQDGAEEIGVSVRYLGSQTGQSAFVFDGLSKNLLETFPAVIAGLGQKQNPIEPNYQNPPPTSRIGVSVQVATIAGVRKLIYIDPHVNSGTIVFRTMCLVLNYAIPCYDIRTLHGSNIVAHNIGARSVGFETGSSGSRTVLLSDPSSDSLPVTGTGITDVRKNFAGAVIKFDGDVLSVLRRGDRPNARLSFGLAFPTSPLLGQSTVLTSSPTDGISNNDTAEFFVLGNTSGNLIKRYTPQLTEENVDLGYAIDGGDDLTGEGISDVVVSAPGEQNEGRVRIYTPGTDYFNRSILKVADGTIRFGHSVATVGPGRLVVADGAGKLYALAVSGSEVGGSEAALCQAPQFSPTPSPTPGVVIDNSDLVELRRTAASVSTLIGGLKFRSGLNSYNSAILKTIKRKTDTIYKLLKYPTITSRDARFTDSYRLDLARRASTLQAKYTKGSAKTRRDAQKRLTAKTNQIVQISAAAIRG